ncbi:MAG: hypothetical protein FWD25_10665 [Clostridia bacterium]|nr:hypothetical protein [Clostridia bacterium]
MEPWKLDRIGSCVRNENPTLIAKLRSGFVVMGDYQFLPGYCVLLAYPQADSLNGLSVAERRQYLLDTTLIGDAIIQACSPLRINYQTMMNADAFLHTHIEARYAWEPDEYRRGPSWRYPIEKRCDPQCAYNKERYGDLKQKIAAALYAIGAMVS